MENYEINLDDELQHHGTKGMKWGQRLYQNKDGSLTELGKKRYNKEVENLKKEKAKVKAEEKALAAKKKTQAKLDKLEAEKKALEDRKKALKDAKRGKTGDEADKNAGETPEQKRERLLKSTDPKEIYKDRDALTYQELNDRVNRIDLEARLSTKIPAEKGRLDSFNEGMKKTADTINNITNTFKKVDDAYSAVTNSAIGKTLAKQLGLEPPNAKVDMQKFFNDIDLKSNKEVQEMANRAENAKKIKDYLGGNNGNKNNNKSANNSTKKDTADAAKKKVAEEEAVKKDTKSSDDTSNKNNSDSTTQSKSNESSGSTQQKKSETYSGKVEGEGTSKSNIKEEFESSKKSNSSNKKPDDYYEPIDMPMSNVPAVVSNRGQDYIAGLFEEDKR